MKGTHMKLKDLRKFDKVTVTGLGTFSGEALYKFGRKFIERQKTLHRIKLIQKVIDDLTQDRRERQAQLSKLRLKSLAIGIDLLLLKK
jgi:hypothetical protein